VARAAADYVALHDPRRGECRLIEFATMGPVRSMGERVVLTIADSIECLSASEAATLSDQIERLRTLPPKARLKTIEVHERKLCDISKIRSEIERFAREARPLCRLSGWMIILMFGGFPLLTLAAGFEIGALLFLALAVITSITAAVFHHHLAAELDPYASNFARWMSTLHLAFYPISVPRCLDGLCFRHFPAFDNAAIAYVIGGRQLAEQAASEFFARIGELEAAADSDATSKALALYRGRRTGALAAFFKEIGSSLDDVLRAPAAHSADSHSYCPSCFAQYKIASGRCTDCSGVMLQSLDLTARTRRGRG
jgi:hypothetical protein